MMYLIKRKPTTSRDELVAHWFANHMPLVIKGQHDQAAQGKPHASRYIATLFDANEKGDHPWDGIAQLWWDKALPMPKAPHGTKPSDTFQQKAEPYVPWASTEYIVMDGSENLKVEPLTLNAPFPCTLSGFYKVDLPREGQSRRRLRWVLLPLVEHACAQCKLDHGRGVRVQVRREPQYRSTG